MYENKVDDPGLLLGVFQVSGVAVHIHRTVTPGFLPHQSQVEKNIKQTAHLDRCPPPSAPYNHTRTCIDYVRN